MIETKIKYENFRAILSQEEDGDYISIFHGDAQIKFDASEAYHLRRILKVLMDLWLTNERDEDDEDFE